MTKILQVSFFFKTSILEEAALEEYFFNVFALSQFTSLKLHNPQRNRLVVLTQKYQMNIVHTQASS